MFKLVCMVLTCMIALAVAGCGTAVSSSSSVVSLELEQSSQTNVSSQTEKEVDVPKETVVKKGDVLRSESLEITINDVTLSYDVLPKTQNSVYTHYAAESGKVYIDIDVSVKNLQKQMLPCDEVMQIIADYNDGYTYTAFPVVAVNTTGFSYANIENIDPLETRGMRFLVDCPQEVEETSNPLFLIMNLDGERFRYILRDGTIDETVAAASGAGKETQADTASGVAEAPIAQQSQAGVNNNQPDYSTWIPYSTSDAGTLAKAIASGNVVYYGGQYVCSPEYFNMFKNEVVVYEHDIASDPPVDRFAMSDIEFEYPDSNLMEDYDVDGIE